MQRFILDAMYDRKSKCCLGDFVKMIVIHFLTFFLIVENKKIQQLWDKIY